MSKLPQSSVLNMPTFRSSIDREDLTRRQAHHVDFELGTPILTGRRRDLEFHLANDGAALPVEECRVLLGVAELIDAGPEFAGHHGLTVAVADLDDVRL